MQNLKINLMVRGQILNGYMNLDVAAKPEESDRMLVNPTDLHPLLDNNEVSEFLCNDILDYLPIQARQQVMNHFIEKLAHGGTLVMTGICPWESSRLLHSNQIDLGQANALFYGIGKKSFADVNTNIQIALANGQMIVEKVSFNASNYCVVFKRK